MFISLIFNIFFGYFQYFFLYFPKIIRMTINFIIKMDKEQIKWHLQIIFVYYTSFADRNNYKLLKKQNYRRFIIDSQCIKHQSSLAHFDIAFQKINNSAIIFKDFLKLIPDIAELVYKGKFGRSDCFRKFMKEHINPLYQQILDKSQFGQDVNVLLSLQIDKKLQKTLNLVQPIHKIYQQYIGSNINKEPLHIFQSLIVLLKDFQLYPQIVSKSLAYIIFLDLIRNKASNQDLFTLWELVKTLICISEVFTRKLLSQQLCSVGKITKLFERMEISIGFSNISKKILYETAISVSLLRSLNSLIKNQFIEQDHCLEKQQEEFSKIFPATTRHKNCGSQSFEFQSFGSVPRKQAKKNELKMENYMTVQSLAHQSVSFQKDFKQIKQAFEELCQYGEVANSKTLKSFKIKKLFERTGIIARTGQAWLDIQIVNLQRGSQSGKMQFPQFLQLLLLTSKKQSCSFDQICHLILNDRIKVDQQREKQLTFAQNYSSNHSQIQYSEGDLELLREILNHSDKALQKIYQYYSHDYTSNQLMSFNELCKAMYDFEIFPTMLSKNRLYQIFNTLNDVRQQSQSSSYPHRKTKSFASNNKNPQLKNYLKQNKKIEFSGFMMALIQIAQQIVQPQLVPPQKLILLLEKINQSAGYKKITNLNLVQQIRNRFGKYYVKSFHKKQKNVQDFDELLEQL